jgi:hypothetical protein
MESWNIIRTGLPNLLEVGWFYLYFGVEDDCPCLFILRNGSLGLPVCHFFTRRGDAVATLIGEEIPKYLFSGDLAKTDQFPCIKG